MKNALLGKSLEVGRIGLGVMGMSAFYTGAGSDDAESIRTIHRALDLGANFMDTAESYGPFVNEELLGRAIADRRDRVAIATKFGTYSHAKGGSGVDSSPGNLAIAIEGSLRRLGTDHIDLYYQHRPDPNTPIEETMGALAELVAAGKILNIGLSNADVDHIRRAHAVHPVAALQQEYSLWTRDLESDGVLDVLRELNIGLVPYSPLGHGFLTGKIRSTEHLADFDWRKTNPRFTGENFQHNLQIADEVEAIATEVGAKASQVALSWLLHQGRDIVPIPGTKSVERLEENCGADGIELTSDQLEKLDNLTPASGPLH